MGVWGGGHLGSFTPALATDVATHRPNPEFHGFSHLVNRIMKSLLSLHDTGEPRNLPRVRDTRPAT